MILKGDFSFLYENIILTIIVFGLCWFLYPFFKILVIYMIKKRKEIKKKLKEKPLTQEEQAEQFRKTTEGLDRALNKVIKERQKWKR